MFNRMQRIFVCLVLVLALVNAAEVRPFLECFVPGSDNFYTAFFGYRTESPGTSASPNVVRGAETLYYQPVTFVSGTRRRFAFYVDFLSEATWALSSGSVSVRSTDSSYICPRTIRVKMSFTGSPSFATRSRISSRSGIPTSKISVKLDYSSNTAIVEFIDAIVDFAEWVASSSVYSSAYWSAGGVARFSSFEILSTGKEKSGVFLPSVHSCSINNLLSTYGSCNEKAQASYTLNLADSVNTNIKLGTNSLVDVSSVFNIYGSLNTGDGSSLTTSLGGILNVHGALTLKKNTVLIKEYSTITSDSIVALNSSLFLFGNVATSTGNFEIADSLVLIGKGASTQITGNLVGTTGISNITMGVTSSIMITGDLDASGIDLLIDITFLDLGKLSTKTNAIKMVHYASAVSEFSSISVTSTDFCVQIAQEYRDDGLYVTFTVENTNNPCPVSGSSAMAAALMFILAVLLL